MLTLRFLLVSFVSLGMLLTMFEGLPGWLLFWAGIGSVVIVGGMATWVAYAEEEETAHYPMSAGYLFTLLGLYSGLKETAGDQAGLISAVSMALVTSVIGWTWGVSLSRSKQGTVERLIADLSKELKGASGELGEGIRQFLASLQKSRSQMDQAARDMAATAKAVREAAAGFQHLQHVDMEQLGRSLQKVVEVAQAVGEGTEHARIVTQQSRALVEDLSGFLDALAKERAKVMNQN